MSLKELLDRTRFDKDITTDEMISEIKELHRKEMIENFRNMPPAGEIMVGFVKGILEEGKKK